MPASTRCPTPQRGGTPPISRASTRHAVRIGVSVDTVLRRYFVGYTLLGDFIFQEAQHDGSLESEEFHRLVRAQGDLFDRLIVTVTEEHTRQAESNLRSLDQRRAECVQRLLAGELVDASMLEYDLDAWRLGAIVVGPESEPAIVAPHPGRGR